MVLEVYKNRNDRNPIVFGGDFLFRQSDGTIDIYSSHNGELLMSTACKELSYSVGANIAYAYESV